MSATLSPQSASESPVGQEHGWGLGSGEIALESILAVLKLRIWRISSWLKKNSKKKKGRKHATHPPIASSALRSAITHLIEMT